MPHISVKHFPGWTEEQRKKIAEGIAREVCETAGCPPEVVSVGIESVDPEEWKEKVFGPEIEEKTHTLYVKPQYEM